MLQCLRTYIWVATPLAIAQRFISFVLLTLSLGVGVVDWV